MMRHMARQQALLTSRSKASVTAAEAAACAVFLAIHGSTKPYIAGYLEREFGYRIPDEKEMSEEIMRAGGTRMLSGIAGISGGAESSMEISMENSSGENTASSLPALCVRAAMTAFLNGRDFEDVLRRAVSLGGNSSDITSIAGGIAEAFFGIPEDLRDQCLRRLPEDLRRAALLIGQYQLTGRCHVYLSPVYGKMEPERIVEFMKSHLMNDVRLQLQVHKIIWDPDRRGV